MWFLLAGAAMGALNAYSQNKQIKAYNNYAKQYNKLQDNNAIRISATAATNYNLQLLDNTKKKQQVEVDRANSLSSLNVSSAIAEASSGDSAVKNVTFQINKEAGSLTSGIGSERQMIDANYINQLYGIQAQADAGKMQMKNKANYATAMLGGMAQAASMYYSGGMGGAGGGAGAK